MSVFLANRRAQRRTRFGELKIDARALHGVQADVEPVTHMNDALLSQIDMQPLESFTFKGANDEEVQGFHGQAAGIRSERRSIR